MATITSDTDGVWATDANWVGDNDPDSGDSAILVTNITVAANQVVGTSPATGGTAAIAFPTSVGGKTLTVNASIILDCLGDISIQSTTAPFYNTLICEAGSTLELTPASGQQHKVTCTNFLGIIILNGSVGARVTFKTDLSSGGLAAYMTLGDQAVGVQTATYADFIDMGDASQFGVMTCLRNSTLPSANASASLTNCTFTRSSYKVILDEAFENWEGNYTFQDIVFTDSVGPASEGTPVCATFLGTGAPSTGVWLINRVGFDQRVSFGLMNPSWRVTNSVLPNGLYLLDNSQWLADRFTGNIVSNSAIQRQFGPIENSFVHSSEASNPHFLGPQRAGCNLIGNVFSAENGGDGDIILLGTEANGDIAINGNLISGKSNAAAGRISCGLGMASGAITADHNTFIGTNDGGWVGLDETSSSYTGQVASACSNLVYGTIAADFIYVVASSGSGTPALDAVTKATHNASRNASTGTCTHNTVTSQAGVARYKGIIVSTAGAFPNAQVGANDVTLTGDPFVDFAYDELAWGAEHSVSGDIDDVIEYMVANPAIATAPDTGLVDSLKASKKVTGAQGLLLQDAGHDAATIGQGEFVASGGGAFGLLGVGA